MKNLHRELCHITLITSKGFGEQNGITRKLQTDDVFGFRSECKQGGKHEKNISEFLSFPISFSRSPLAVLTELYYDRWHPGETNIYSVSKTGFAVAEQDSGGFFGWYWLAFGL